MQIDKSQNDHGAGEQAGNKKRYIQGITAEKDKKGQGCQKFDKKVGKWNGCFAVPALSFQDQIGQDRDVVIWPYPFPADRAG
jgi:hypothetical protein